MLLSKGHLVLILVWSLKLVQYNVCQQSVVQIEVSSRCSWVLGGDIWKVLVLGVVFLTLQLGFGWVDVGKVGNLLGCFGVLF